MCDATRTGLVTIADYQFGAGAGNALFTETDFEILTSKSGRPTQIIADDGRLVTLGADGRFTLGYAGGRRLASALEPPAYRVRVGTESESFVRDGANAFAKFVHDVDPAVRPFDEVLVTARDGTLLGVGRAELSAVAMDAFDRGVAVSVREGQAEWEVRAH